MAESQPVPAADIDRITRFARSAGGAAVRGDIDYVQADTLILWAAWCSPRYRHLTDDQLYRLETVGMLALDDAMFTPGLVASAAVRQSIASLLREKKPRAEILVAAYRAANGRLDAADVEQVVTEEIAAFMARVRGG